MENVWSPVLTPMVAIIALVIMVMYLMMIVVIVMVRGNETFDIVLSLL